MILSLSALGVFLIGFTPVLLCAHGTHGQLMGVVNQKLESSPTDANLWVQRGILNLDHEDAAQAIEDLEKAERLAPGKLPTFWLKGRAMELSGKLAEARAALDVHLMRCPDHAAGYTSRARVLVKLGARNEALADYRTALVKSPDAEPDLVHEAAVALNVSGHRDEALTVLDAGLKRLGETPSLALKALEIEVTAGRYDAALARVEAHQKSAPRAEPWMAKRAELLAQAGRLAESRAAWLALVVHLANLPNPERGSHAMSLLAEQARYALRSAAKPAGH